MFEIIKQLEQMIQFLLWITADVFIILALLVFIGWAVMYPAEFIYKNCLKSDDFWQVFNELKRQGKLRYNNRKKTDVV